MKITIIKIQLIIITLLISLLPISAIAMAPRPCNPGHGGTTGVPEPSTLLLLAAGGGVMLVKRYGKRK